MDAIIEEHFENKYGKNPSGGLYFLKRQVKKHMADVLKYYYLPLLKEKTLTILESEEEIEERVESFKLKGRLDSVEQRNDKTVIVDYKTGSSPNYLKIALEKLDVGSRETWDKAIGSLQLPFYLLLYVEKTGKPINELDALFLLLGRQTINRDIELALFDGSSAAEMYAPLRAVIFKLLKEIINPLIPFGPATNKKKVCPSCDFQYVCGTQWVVK